jgi:signal peptidase complex subunit 2
MSGSERISVYNLSDLKNTSDDAIPNYLNSLKFRQSHTLVDTRLALGYSAFAVSAACFAWDYKLGWDATKQYTAMAVGVYILLNTALTLWVTLREKSIVYEGTSPAGEKVRRLSYPGKAQALMFSGRSPSRQLPRRTSRYTTSTCGQ